MFIACKYEEVYAVPHVRDLVYVCDNAYTKEEILKAEGHIVQILSFDLVTISPWNFLSLYQELIQMEEKNFMLTRYLIELGILEYSTMKFDCSIMACAAIYLVNKIRRINPAFPDELVNFN